MGTGPSDNECKRVPQVKESLGMLVSTTERLEKKLLEL